MDAGAGAPAEPKEADGDEEAADAGSGEAEFGLDGAVFVESGFKVFVHPPVERGDDDQGSDEDADVC